MLKYDIGIIGAGVAGLSTALHACSGLDGTIVIIDRGKIGDPMKTSPFTFPDVVERYALSDAVLQEYTRFTYKSPTGVSATFEYDRPTFVTLNYKKLCDILVDRIMHEGYVKILEKTEATDFNVNKSFLRTEDITVRVSNSEDIMVKVLVDASGKSFFAARKLRIKLPPLYSHPYGELLEGCRVEDPEDLCIFSGKKYGNGGGWFYPIDERTARFGFATVTDSLVYPMAVVKQNYVDARKNFSPYSEMLADAKTVRSELGTIPLGLLQKLVYDRILFVGDAAGQATPWYCEGIRPALEGGEICGETLREACKRNWSKRVLEKYQKRWDDKKRRLYSRNMKCCQRSWFRTQVEWDNAVKSATSLTPEEMIQRVRYARYIQRKG